MKALSLTIAIAILTSSCSNGQNNSARNTQNNHTITLNSIKERYSSSDIQFLSMTYESKEEVIKFLKKTKIIGGLSQT